jgi:LPXTG-site transpeptidase (sortase) family protein
VLAERGEVLLHLGGELPGGGEDQGPGAAALGWLRLVEPLEHGQGEGGGLAATGHGANVSWLGNQAGWLEGSAFPSWNGNSVLTSHIYLSNGKPGPFAKLHELQTGDKIFVHAFGQKFTFEVLTNATITPTDRSVMRHEERPWLTLVTCADYDLKTGTYKNRFIVRAVLVNVSMDK